MNTHKATENLLADKLLPDQLKAFWRLVQAHRVSEEAYATEQERLLGEAIEIWRGALQLAEHPSLEASLLAELGEYVDCHDLAEVRRRCQDAMTGVEREWLEHVRPGDPQSIERFYDQNPVHLYELTWWHTVVADRSPLAYVTALQLARQRGCRHYLDFGAGIGSGGILFARHGFTVALADISTTLLDFCEWRFGYKRSLPAEVIDLKFVGLPRQAFDVVTAMDVFEHLVDPVQTLEQVWESLKPGGFLFGRFDDRARDHDREGAGSLEHIVKDFGPMFARMRALGFAEVWQDDWLWGHQAFQKR